MAEFIYGQALKTAIEEILAEPGGRHAVAFWGRNSDHKLPKNGRGQFRIICNLAMGGTNPFAIEQIKRANIRQCDTLHAKVYIGSKHAVVTSANASSNGLGFEGLEVAKWVEAGIRTDDIAEISKWFEDLWDGDDAREVSDPDLEAAKVLWWRRQIPTLRFADFDADGSRLPLLYWVGEADYENNEAAMIKQFGSVSEESHAIVDESLEVESPSDAEVMRPGAWMIVWSRAAKGLPRKRPKPYWFQAGRVLPKSFRYTGEKRWRDSVAKSDIVASPPFELDPAFLGAFERTLSDPAFDDLRTDDYEGAWFTPSRLELAREFWRDCKHRYLTDHRTG